MTTSPHSTSVVAVAAQRHYEDVLATFAFRDAVDNYFRPIVAALGSVKEAPTTEAIAALRLVVDALMRWAPRHVLTFDQLSLPNERRLFVTWLELQRALLRNCSEDDDDSARRYALVVDRLLRLLDTYAQRFGLSLLEPLESLEDVERARSAPLDWLRTMQQVVGSNPENGHVQFFERERAAWTPTLQNAFRNSTDPSVVRQQVNDIVGRFAQERYPLPTSGDVSSDAVESDDDNDAGDDAMLVRRAEALADEQSNDRTVRRLGSFGWMLIVDAEQQSSLDDAVRDLSTQPDALLDFVVRAQRRERASIDDRRRVLYDVLARVAAPPSPHDDDADLDKVKRALTPHDLRQLARLLKRTPIEVSQAIGPESNGSVRFDSAELQRIVNLHCRSEKDSAYRSGVLVMLESIVQCDDAFDEALAYLFHGDHFEPLRARRCSTWLRRYAAGRQRAPTTMTELAQTRRHRNATASPQPSLTPRNFVDQLVERNLALEHQVIQLDGRLAALERQRDDLRADRDAVLSHSKREHDEARAMFTQEVAVRDTRLEQLENDLALSEQALSDARVEKEQLERALVDAAERGARALRQNAMRVRTRAERVAEEQREVHQRLQEDATDLAVDLHAKKRQLTAAMRQLAQATQQKNAAEQQLAAIVEQRNSARALVAVHERRALDQRNQLAELEQLLEAERRQAVDLRKRLQKQTLAAASMDSIDGGALHHPRQQQRTLTANIADADADVAQQEKRVQQQRARVKQSDALHRKVVNEISGADEQLSPLRQAIVKAQKAEDAARSELEKRADAWQLERAQLIADLEAQRHAARLALYDVQHNAQPATDDRWASTLRARVNRLADIVDQFRFYG